MKTETKQLNTNPAHRFARLSLLSITLTAVLTTIHHYYKLGNGAFILGVIMIGLPIIFLNWFRKKKTAVPFVLYGLMNVWVIIGFGIVDGFWDSTIKVYFSNFLFHNSRLFIRSPLGSFPFEVTGVFAFIASLFATYYGYKFLKAVIANKPTWNPWNQRVKWIAVPLVIAGILLAGFDSYRHSIVIPKNKVVKIGIIIPVDGPGKLLGTSFLKAVEMAKEDVMNSKTKNSYELVIENSGTSPAETEVAIQKLINKEHVQAIVGGISASGRIVKPYVTAAKIPHLCVCSVKTIGDGEYNFTNIPIAEDEAIEWIKEAKKRNIKTIAIINQKYPSIEGHVKALKDEAKNSGIQVLFEKEFEANTTDFTTVINEAKKTVADIYFISGFPPTLDTLGEQLKKAGINNLASIVAFSVSNNPGLFEGNWYTDSYVNEEFEKRFEQKYPEERFATHMMPYAYDSYKMMVEAFESGEDPTSYLQSLTNYPGTSGTITRKTGEGNFRSTPVVWIIKNGKPELLYKK
jgi:ABC-type branched-subunit amino acid transport system substrate-binding protein